MGAHTLLSRNLGILIKLTEGSATIEELAKSEACPQGLLRTPLKVLLENNLITDDNGHYALNSKSSESYNLLEMMKPWLNYRDDSNYTLAKDVAKIIHEYSYDGVEVKSVLLFGSTLKKDKVPGDIDMLILHNGLKLAEFYKDPYGERVNDPRESDSPAKDNNMRVTSTSIINTLGYKSLPNDDGLSDWKRWSQDSVYGNIVRRLKDVLELTSKEVAAAEKFHTINDDEKIIRNKVNNSINEILDIHALKTTLFTERWAQDSVKKAIESCRDPTFWYTVLSEGMIYDVKKQDFTIKPSERYRIEVFNTKS